MPEAPRKFKFPTAIPSLTVVAIVILMIAIPFIFAGVAAIPGLSGASVTFLQALTIMIIGSFVVALFASAHGED